MGGKREGAGKEISPETIALCKAYKRLIAEGGDVKPFIMEWAVNLGVQRPAIWRRLRSGGAVEPYKQKKEGGMGRPIGGGEPGYTQKRTDAALRAVFKIDVSHMPRVERDPCSFCGVRGDVGCKHRRP